MKADRLTRKTYLKKNSIRPEGEITLYDLTTHNGENHDAVYMYDFSDFVSEADHDIDKIAAMPYGFDTQADILCWCALLLKESPLASRLWEEAVTEGWQIGVSDLQSNGFHLDLDQKKLLLDHFALTPSALGRSAYFRNTLLITLIRALRDIWHEHRYEPFELNYAPEDSLMLERVRAADCDATTILAVWELRGAGFAEIWRHLIGSAEGDMAMVFSKYLERDPTALFDGSALTYAFRQWYADETRVDGCDHESLELLDDVLLCAKDNNPFGARELKAEDIESLSVLPDGTCYLKGLGQTICEDPFFAGLKDEINQTHFFQLIYDLEVTMVNNVPFRDKTLARKLFPGDINH